MSQTTRPSTAPTLHIGPHRLVARLRIPADCPADLASDAALLHLVRQAGLAVDAGVEARVARLSRRWHQAPAEIDAVVATGRAPGTDGGPHLRWQAKFDPTRHSAPNPGSAKPVNFYEQSPFRVVEAGERVATLLPDSDGIDVFGEPIPVEADGPCGLRWDKTIQLRHRAELHAVCAGVLHYDGQYLRVAPVLNVEQDVNFATGNIRFDGAVIIHGDVLDQFEVDCAGDLEVRGLIEAAEVRCGGNLRARGGMAGKEAGCLRVTGDAAARYLHGTAVEIGGDLHVERSVTNVHLCVEGRLDLRWGTLIGGEVRAGGSAAVGTLGAPAATPTHLRLGYVPELSDQMTQVHAALVQAELRLTELGHDLSNLAADASEGQESARQAETRLALTDVRDRLQRKRERASKHFSQLHQAFHKRSVSCLYVTQQLHPGVLINLPGWEVEVLDPMTGPLRLTLDGTDRVRLEDGAGEEIVAGESLRLRRTGTW